MQYFGRVIFYAIALATSWVLMHWLGVLPER